VTVKIGKYTGTIGGTTINTALLTSLATATTTPANTSSGVLLNVPIVADVPVGGKFVVQVSVPDRTSSGYFFLGTTSGAETQPGYWSSSACGHSSPVKTSDASVGQTTHNIIEVSGTH
jgi:hypothetical protein